MSAERCTVGVDVGGTFTDVVVHTDSGRRLLHKVLTTPKDPLEAICRGIEDALRLAGLAPSAVIRIVHGTTLATNAILEGTGSTVAFVTTSGFGDLLRLGRQARVEEDRFDPFFESQPALVPYERTFEVEERLDSRGAVVLPLDPRHAVHIADAVAASTPEAVAVSLLHSYANPVHERILVEACQAAMPGVFVVASADVWPEPREYDRAVATVLSAMLAPTMATYLTRFEERLRSMGVGATLEVMESSGGVMTAHRAAQRPLATVESGGAAGLIAAARIGRDTGNERVISFDMGGTTAKAGIVVDGRPQVTNQFQVGGKGSFGTSRSGTGLPIKLPVVDLAEVGAGGGSVAWIDAGGSLHVGPVSSGSEPGPACYGRGGTRPTVTDANLILGYIDPERMADGLQLDREAAVDALSSLGAELGLDHVDAAWAVHDLATDGMATAVRVVTLNRGLDPRDHVLIGFGGAGPVHVAGLAARFGIRRVIVPWGAGVASAVGLCAANPTVNKVRTLPVRAAVDDMASIREGFRQLELEARADLELSDDDLVVLHRQVDARYVGQAHQVTADIPTAGADATLAADVDAAFRTEYLRRYGIDRPDAPIEVVSLRLQLVQPVDVTQLPVARATAAASRVVGRRRAYFESTGFVDVDVHDWDELDDTVAVHGPALIASSETTVVVPPGTIATVGLNRNIHLDA